MHPDLDGQFALWVSTHCLVEDLLSSIALFKTGMGDVTTRTERWNNVASELVKPTPYPFKVTQTEPYA